MRMLLSGIVVAAACLGVGGYVFHTALGTAAQKPSTQPVDRIAVEVTHVRRRTIQERADLVGSLMANATVTIRAKTGGYVTRLPYDVGDLVKVNQPIVELDQTRHLETVSRSEAAMKVARAQLRAQETRKTQAEKEFTRQEQLSRSRVSTAEQLEAAAAALAIATAEHDLEQARVDQAESDLQRSRLTLDETRVLSPITGYIANRMVDVGDLADPVTDLLQIVELSKVRTVVHVVERDYPKVEVNQSASIRVDAFPDEVFTGKVVRKAPVLDNQTRTAAVQIEIQNPKTLLKPGMHARVTIVFGVHQDADVVPIASLIDRGENPTVYVVQGDPPVSVLQHVKTGLSDGDMVEILSGLKPDDMVVTLGSRLIQNGQEVTPMEPPTSGDPEESKRDSSAAE